MLSALDIAAGEPLPHTLPALEPIAMRSSPLDALCAVVRDGLARPPCLVSFSGGLDSSAVLAVAVHVARAEQLPAPIPISWRFADAPLAQEDAWQDRVLRALGLDDRVVLSRGEDLDIVGPVARAVHEQHGLLWPANTFLHAPLVEQAGGGSLLTGAGGDQLLVLWHPRWRALADARAGRRAWTPRDVARRVAAATPLPARRVWERRADPPVLPWLTPAANGAVARADERRRAEIPVRYDDYLGWMARQREVVLARESLRSLGAAADARVLSPLLDERFLAALGRAGERDGFGGRTALLREILGPLWPDTLDERRTKATFDEVFWRSPAREAARKWDGAGLDGNLVRRDELRREWLSPAPHLRSALALQAVVFGSSGARGSVELT